MACLLAATAAPVGADSQGKPRLEAGYTMSGSFHQQTLKTETLPENELAPHGVLVFVCRNGIPNGGVVPEMKPVYVEVHDARTHALNYTAFGTSRFPLGSGLVDSLRNRLRIVGSITVDFTYLSCNGNEIPNLGGTKGGPTVVVDGDGTGTGSGRHASESDGKRSGHAPAAPKPSTPSKK
jgi:hypothetical protein